MENERFMNYVLFEKIKETKFITSYRVAKPMANPVHEQLDLIDPKLSKNAKFSTVLSEHLTKIQNDPDIQGILKIKDFGLEDGQFYIIRDYRNSKSLREIIEESNEQYFPINLEHAVYIIRQNTAFFQYITSEMDKEALIYYIDPEDMRITFEGEIFLENIYLADAIQKAFGKDMSIFGSSISYFPPEYIKDQKRGEKAIIFSLGAIFYEILSNKKLLPDNLEDYKNTLKNFVYPEESSFEEEIDQQLLDIILKMINIDIDQRYSSFQELKHDLDEYMEEGSFSPTTFHFVFFLETLFRDFVDNHSDILEKEIKKAKLLEMEAIRESEEEMLKQKVVETSKESKFPIIPVIVVILFIGLIIAGLTMQRSWTDEAAELIRQQREERERLLAEGYSEPEIERRLEEMEESILEKEREVPEPERVEPDPVPETPRPEPDPVVEPDPDPADSQRQEEIERERQERLAREREEAERLAAEQEEAERLAAEQEEAERLERERTEIAQRVGDLANTARSHISDENASEARSTIAQILEIDPDNPVAEDLYLEVELLERRLRRSEREALRDVPINIAEADTPPTLVNPPNIDLRQVENRIPRDVLRDLKNRVNRITVRLLINESGDVERIEEVIVQRAVYGTFERTGLIAEIERQVMTAKYTPAILDGMARKCYVTLTFPWR